MEDEQRAAMGAGAGAGAGARWARAARRRLPCLRWAARYSRLAAAADLVAGLTLGLTLVPQSIAYAALADLPVHYGLYSAFVGTILYTALGTVKEVSIGPTSLMALMTLQTCRGLPPECVVLLTFLSGALVTLMGLLRLGFLVEFISPSVTSGFTSGTAVIIVVSQLKGLLGLTFVAESVPENLGLIAGSLQRVRRADMALAALCCAALLLLRKVKDIKVSPKRPGLKKLLWLVSIARNALVVCGCSAAAYCLHDPDNPLFLLSGRVQAGLPALRLPPFSARVHNRTVHFAEMVQLLTPGLYTMPVVMVLANIAIAKAFTPGGRVDATQEMLTLGLCNMAGSLVSAMPTCGAFTRSAVSHSSGVRTPAAGLYSGIITLLALKYMTQYFYFIPRACLSSVLICAVIFMVDVSAVPRLWRAERRELAVLAATFAVSVARSVEAALVAGAAAALAALLAALVAARPAPRAHPAAPAAALPAVLVYFNAEAAAARLLALAAPRRPLLVDAGALALLDYGASQVLERLITQLKAIDARLVLFNASGEALKRCERIAGVDRRALRAPHADAALALLAGRAGPGAGPGAGSGAGPDAAAPLLRADTSEHLTIVNCTDKKF